MKKKIGITGQNGFVGYHLYHTLGFFPDEFERVNFQREFFDDTNQMDEFVKECDVIIHLAAINRHESQEYIHDTNIKLTQRLVSSLERTGSRPHLIFSSSSQEEKDNLYGQSKKKSREMLSDWANANQARFSGMIVPNVFGPFGRPFYNSFIATFCYQLIHGQIPQVDSDAEIPLIYIGDLVDEILKIIRNQDNTHDIRVNAGGIRSVTEVLKIIEKFQNTYLEKGEIPSLEDRMELQLFNTYRSFIDPKDFFPKKLIKHTDSRGSFVEIIRLGVGGQCSFSTTSPRVTRGEHYHTRKIERFAVIKGQARIQMRKIGTNEKLNFDLCGDDPAYVDMPVWYTHNITNTGTEDLYTIFWINEAYNDNDADTWFEKV